MPRCAPRQVNHAAAKGRPACDGVLVTDRVQLAEWISLERRCCPFLEFALEWKRDDSVSVRLTGEAGVKQFIAAEMGITMD